VLADLDARRLAALLLAASLEARVDETTSAPRDRHLPNCATRRADHRELAHRRVGKPPQRLTKEPTSASPQSRGLGGKNAARQVRELTTASEGRRRALPSPRPPVLRARSGRPSPPASRPFARSSTRCWTPYNRTKSTPAAPLELGQEDVEAPREAKRAESRRTRLELAVGRGRRARRESAVQVAFAPGVT